MGRDGRGEAPSERPERSPVQDVNPTAGDLLSVFGLPGNSASCWSQQVRFAKDRELLSSEVLKGKVGLLLSGLALRQRLVRRGERQAIDIYMPGDVLGIETAILGQNATELRALSPLAVAVCDVAGFSRALGVPGFAATVLTVIAQQQRRLENRIVRLGRLQAEARIAAFIADLHRRLGGNGTTLHLGLTQQDLANLLGLTPIHVNRVLRDLAARNVLSFRRGVAAIHDIETLRRTACEHGAICPAKLGL